MNVVSADVVPGDEVRHADPAMVALGELLARVAEARWAGLLGQGRVRFAGMARQVPRTGARAMVAVRVGATAAGWMRAAFGLEGGGPERGEDTRVLLAWLEGAGASLEDLLAESVEVRAVAAGDRPEQPEDVPALALEFGYSLSARRGTTWVWMEPGLLARCLEALGAAPPVAPAAAAAAPASTYADELPPLAGGPAQPSLRDTKVLLDVPLVVAVELGRTERQIREILNLVPGSVLDLDRLAGDPLDVMVNGRRIARAEVLVLDERFAIRITEILSPTERLDSLG